MIAAVGASAHRLPERPSDLISELLGDCHQFGHLAGCDEGRTVTVSVNEEGQNGSEAAILEECAAVENVSAVRLDVLFELHDLLHHYHYPLDVVLGLLEPVQTPDEMRASLADLARPKPAFDFSDWLELIWERQQTRAEGEVVYYQSLRQDHPVWKEALTRDEMDAQMLWLERASGGLSMWTRMRSPS